MEKNHIPVTTKITIIEERATMITESRIEHLEELIHSADKFEKKIPIWNKVRQWLAVCCSLTSLFGGIIITLYFTDFDKLKEPKTFLLFLLCGMSVMGILVCWHLISIEKQLSHDVYESNLTKVQNILNKLKTQMAKEHTS